MRTKNDWRSVLGLPLLAGCTFSGAHVPESPYAASAQYADGVFHNQDGVPGLAGAGNWQAGLRTLFRTKVDTVPRTAIPVRQLTKQVLDDLDGNANHLVRLGHSSLLLMLQGKVWLVDPVLSRRASPVRFAGPRRYSEPPLRLEALQETLPDIEGVVISHDHYDHLDAPTIAFLSTRARRYLVPLGLKARLVGMGVAAARIIELDWWQSATLDGLVVTATPAQHFSGRGPWDSNRTLWASWVFESAGQRIFFSGDSGYFDGFRQIGERFGAFDAVCIENGAYDPAWPGIHMRPEQTLQAFLDLRGKLLVPVHNAAFDLAFHPWSEPLDAIARLADAHGIALATPQLGEPITIGRTRVNQRWWEGLR
jgi:L-ascorbate metabolism protein UlaG (beta-lactamase superfamily)